MRTEVKVGLISAFLVGIGLVGYIVFQQKKSTTPLVPHVDKSMDSAAESGARSEDGSFSVSNPMLAPPLVPATTTAASLPATMPELSTTGPATTTAPIADIRGPWDDSTLHPGTLHPTLPDTLGTHTLPPTDGLSTSSWDSTTNTETTHTIVKGDTFGSLAKQYHTTIKAITKANPGVDSSHLKIGQKINIPGAAASGSSVTSTPGTDSGTSTGTTTSPARRTASGTSASHTTPVTAVPGGTYKVQKGDSLRKISKRVYGSEKYWERIARVNRNVLRGNPNNIEVGMVLTLPPK